MLPFSLLVAQADTDFTHDSQPDLLFRDNTTNAMTAWTWNGTSFSSTSLPVYPAGVPTTWEVVGTPDLDGDGNADLLWFDVGNVSGSGDVHYTLMNGTTQLSAGVVSTGVPTIWKVVGTGDFNKDGKADILWYNTQTGDLAVWYMNGITYVGSATIASAVPRNYTPKGCADFNKDGNLDILWQDSSTGGVYAWLMKGITYKSSATISTSVTSSYSLVGIADLNRDGNPDLLWQDTLGKLYAWYMNGTTLTSSVQIGSGITSNAKMVGMRGNGNDLAFQIRNLPANSTLSDQVMVNLGVVPNLKYHYGAVNFYVDGVLVAISGDYSHYGTTDRRQQTVNFQTNLFANGNHTVAAKDQFGNFDSRVVTFNNPFTQVTTDDLFELRAERETRS